MTPTEALAQLRGRGVLLYLDDDQLRYRGPIGVVTNKTIAYMRRHKFALIDLLRAEAEADPDAVRLRAAMATFGAEAEPLDPRLVDYGTMTCFACGFERNRELPACPRCRPVAKLPPGCLARTLCSAVGACERRAAGRPCCVDANEETEVAA